MECLARSEPVDQPGSSRGESEGANLAGALLRGADLGKANFTRANLTDAVLGGCDFSGADLNGTNLSLANLSNAQLTGVQWQLLAMRGCYLGVRGLDSCFGNALFKRAAADQDFLSVVRPATLAGEIIVSSEVVLGYTTLGLLRSVLAQSIARRS